MRAAHGVTRQIEVPVELGLDTRVGFREAAIRELDLLPEGSALGLDLGRTARVDSAGLSALMLIQRHAAGRNQRIVLLRPSDEFRYLLALTRMSDLFAMEPARA
jgi:ABC-type transporter Mla MlaB component